MRAEQPSVIQVGPVISMPGGIAAVIEQYISMDLGERRVVAYASYWPGRPIRGILAAAVFPMWALVRHRRRDTIVHVHLSEGGSFVREGFIAWMAGLLGYRVVATLHGAGFADHAIRHPVSVRRVLQAMETVFCLGEVHATMVRDMTTRPTVALILNPVDINRRDSAGAPLAPTVVFGGEVGTRKGVDRLLAAWPQVLLRVPEAKLVICGPQTGEIELLDGVDYRGVLDREALRATLAMATVACLPSRKEVLPMFILESLAEGTPVVATTAGEWRSFGGVADIAWVDNSDATVVDALAVALITALVEPRRTSDATDQWLSEHASTEAVSASLRNGYERSSEETQ